MGLLELVCTPQASLAAIEAALADDTTRGDALARALADPVAVANLDRLAELPRTLLRILQAANAGPATVGRLGEPTRRALVRCIVGGAQTPYTLQLLATLPDADELAVVLAVAPEAGTPRSSLALAILARFRSNPAAAAAVERLLRACLVGVRVRALAELAPLYPDAVVQLFDAHELQSLGQSDPATSLRTLAAVAALPGCWEHVLPHRKLLEAALAGTLSEALACAALALVKLSGRAQGVGLDPVWDYMLSVTIDVDTAAAAPALEALAALLLVGKYRQKMRAQAARFIELLGLKPTGHTFYSVVTILGQMAAPAQSEAHVAFDVPAEIEAFHQQLVQLQELAAVCGAGMGKYTPGSGSAVVQLVAHVARPNNRQVRQALAQQHGADVVMEYALSKSEVVDGRMVALGEDPVRTLAVQAIAKFLVSNNPGEVFLWSGNLLPKYPLRAAALFIAETLPDADLPEGELSPELLESLLALTNLALVEDAPTNRVLAHAGFAGVYGCTRMHYPNTVRRSAWECLLNLMTEPHVLARFFDASQAPSRTRLDAAEAGLGDAGVAEAVAVLLANAVDIPLVRTELQQRPGLLVAAAALPTPAAAYLAETLRAG